MRNPINLNTSIDLLPTIQELQPAYGRFADSGLFKEYGIKTNAVIYSVEQQENARMTKLTSRTERDAVKVSRGKSKQVTWLGIHSIPCSEGCRWNHLCPLLARSWNLSTYWHGEVSSSDTT